MQAGRRAAASGQARATGCVRMACKSAACVCRLGGCEGAVVRQCLWWCAVCSVVVRSGRAASKTERLQDGAAPSAFEKRTESGTATFCRGSELERSARSARYGPHLSLR